MIRRAQWQHHPRWPQQTLLLGSHEAFRKRSAWIIDRVEALAGDDVRRARRWLARMRTDFDWWMSGMSGHERYEERKLYPFLARRWNTEFDELVAGHQALHHQRDDVREAFRRALAAGVDIAAASADVLRALTAHRRVLVDHLRDEEDRVIPLLLELAPEEFSKKFG